MARTVCVIPARMGSSRFPGKPLAKLLGMPMVVHIAHRCKLSGKLEEAYIATCDQEIMDASRAAGFQAVMTRDDHERCTDRTSEAIANLGLGLADNDLVVMVQGDEVLVTPDMIDLIIDEFHRTKAPVINVVTRIATVEEHDDPNVVKVVGAPDGRAMYLSRAPIPSRARNPDFIAYQQTGIIGLSAGFLDAFGRLSQTPMEQAESVDMLRVLEHNLELRFVYVEQPTIGVDTPDELDRAEARLRRDPVRAQYLSMSGCEGLS